jgi:hypothetical protein
LFSLLFVDRDDRSIAEDDLLEIRTKIWEGFNEKSN